MTIITSSLIWSLLGLSLIIAELFLPAIGLLFLGLGSLTNAILVYYYAISFSYQLISTGLMALAWFLVLWRPLNSFIYAKKRHGQKDYFDFVGTKVQVSSDIISPGDEGTAIWSGTIMRIKLVDSENIAAMKGENLYVKSVQGNILYCSRNE